MNDALALAASALGGLWLWWRADIVGLFASILVERRIVSAADAPTWAPQWLFRWVPRRVGGRR